MDQSDDMNLSFNFNLDIPEPCIRAFKEGQALRRAKEKKIKDEKGDGIGGFSAEELKRMADNNIYAFKVDIGNDAANPINISSFGDSSGSSDGKTTLSNALKYLLSGMFGDSKSKCSGSTTPDVKSDTANFLLSLINNSTMTDKKRDDKKDGSKSGMELFGSLINGLSSALTTNKESNLNNGNNPSEDKKNKNEEKKEEDVFWMIPLSKILPFVLKQVRDKNVYEVSEVFITNMVQDLFSYLEDDKYRIFIKRAIIGLYFPEVYGWRPIEKSTTLVRSGTCEVLMIDLYHFLSTNKYVKNERSGNYSVNITKIINACENGINEKLKEEESKSGFEHNIGNLLKALGSSLGDGKDTKETAINNIVGGLFKTVGNKLISDSNSKPKNKNNEDDVASGKKDVIWTVPKCKFGPMLLMFINSTSIQEVSEALISLLLGQLFVEIGDSKHQVLIQRFITSLYFPKVWSSKPIEGSHILMRAGTYGTIFYDLYKFLVVNEYIEIGEIDQNEDCRINITKIENVCKNDDSAVIIEVSSKFIEEFLQDTFNYNKLSEYDQNITRNFMHRLYFGSSITKIKGSESLIRRDIEKVLIADLAVFLFTNKYVSIDLSFNIKPNIQKMKEACEDHGEGVKNEGKDLKDGGLGDLLGSMFKMFGGVESGSSSDKKDSEMKITRKDKDGKEEPGTIEDVFKSIFGLVADKLTKPDEPKENEVIEISKDNLKHIVALLGKVVKLTEDETKVMTLFTSILYFPVSPDKQIPGSEVLIRKGTRSELACDLSGFLHRNKFLSHPTNDPDKCVFDSNRVLLLAKNRAGYKTFKDVDQSEDKDNIIQITPQNVHYAVGLVYALNVMDEDKLMIFKALISNLYFPTTHAIPNSDALIRKGRRYEFADDLMKFLIKNEYFVPMHGKDKDSYNFDVMKALNDIKDCFGSFDVRGQHLVFNEDTASQVVDIAKELADGSKPINAESFLHGVVEVAKKMGAKVPDDWNKNKNKKSKEGKELREKKDKDKDKDEEEKKSDPDEIIEISPEFIDFALKNINQQCQLNEEEQVVIRKFVNKLYFGSGSDKIKGSESLIRKGLKVNITSDLTRFILTNGYVSFGGPFGMKPDIQKMKKTCEGYKEDFKNEGEEKTDINFGNILSTMFKMFGNKVESGPSSDDRDGKDKKEDKEKNEEEEKEIEEFKEILGKSETKNQTKGESTGEKSNQEEKKEIPQVFDVIKNLMPKVIGMVTSLEKTVEKDKGFNIGNMVKEISNVLETSGVMPPDFTPDQRDESIEMATKGCEAMGVPQFYDDVIKSKIEKDKEEDKEKEQKESKTSDKDKKD